ncbi:MAG: lipopolysaccharide heptosyltransferase II [candidate division Zixibacteria bacterium]|nr:lipopolysaccharide heptosyltransferase II [candidate division Zixibacteria bacterium]
MNPKKILIIQTAFLGDVILCTPLLKAVRKKYPSGEIFFLVIPQTAGLLQNNPHINQVMIYDKKGKDRGFLNYVKLVRKIRAENFDMAFLPHRSFRSSLLAYLSGIPRRIGFNKNSASFLLTEKIRYVQNMPEVKRNLVLVEDKFSSDNDFLPELFPSGSDFKYVEDLFKLWDIGGSNKIVVIAPGSVWETKRWLPERFGEAADLIIDKLKAKVVFLGGKDDFELCLKISENMKNKSFVAAGKTSPLQSAALLSKCKVVLSNDTAPMHMGVAMRTPVVAIFGSTVPGFGFAPTGDRDVIIQKEVYCRPCGIHGKRKCPEKHFRCMKDISTEEIMEAISRMV